MSPAHKNAVDSLLKRLQHMMGRHAPGTHDPDDPHICRILHTTDPSQVSSGVRSPGAQKSDDLGFKMCVAHWFLSLSKLSSFFLQQAAPICTKSCSGLYPRRLALWDGQAEAQFPHPLHKI